MLQAKYKAHRLINIIFYLIVFLVGFYIGSIGKKFNIKDIFSNFLFIDNVSALSSTSNYYPSSYSPAPSFGDNGTYKNEQYIYNLFNHFVDYYDYPIVFNQFHYVLTYGFSNVSGTHIEWLFTDSPLQGTISDYTTNNYLRITYSSGNNPPYKWHISTGSSSHTTSSMSGYYSNQSGFGTSTLDFSNYYTIFFNPYLFDNFTGFKEECIDPHKAFIVSTNTIIDNNKQQVDFFWFGGQFTNLKNASFYPDNSISTFEYINSDIQYFNTNDMLVKSKNILSISNTTNYNSVGNINFYQWSAIPFNFHYNSDSLSSNGDFVSDIINSIGTIYPVYKFDDKFTLTIPSSNGSGRSHIDLTNSSSDNLQICFYIRDIYDITNLEQDENDFYYGTITTPDGDKDIYIDSINYGFFNTFQSDTYGLVSFLQAPIKAFQKISDGVCTPQNINILGKTISLPCGDTIFWGREDVQSFKQFWNIFLGGLLAYGSGIYLFKSIQKVKDPDHSKIEVIDL